MIYLDNAATTYPKPEIVKKSVIKSMTSYGANPGRGFYKMNVESAKAVYSVRKKVADFFECEKEESVIFTKNCTESLNMVLNGVLKSGDHVVVSDLEHNAVMRPIYNLFKKGVSYSVFKTYQDNDETVNSLRNEIRENTKLMVCTAASNVFGIKLPVGRLCSLCKIYDIKTCIDAAQAAGLMKLSMEEDRIDFLCMPSHKGLYGIMGSGMLITKESLNPFQYGGTGSNSLSHDMPLDLPERLESGTLNVPGIVSIGAGIDFINSIGREKMYLEEMKKIKVIYNGLKDMKKVILYTQIPEIDKFVPVLSFNIKDRACEDITEYYAKNGIALRGGFHCAPLAHQSMNTKSGTVRLSISAFTNHYDINNFLLISRKL